MSWPGDPYDDGARSRNGVAEAVRRSWRRVVTPAMPDPGRARNGSGPEPRRAGWTRVLGVSLAAFFLWLLLDAPTLQHNAQVSPVGTRRTVSLDVLGPLATISRDLGLSHVVSVANGVLGRSGNQPGNGSPALRPPHRVGSLSVPTTTVPRVVLNRHPSAQDPLRVLVLGDSLGIDLGDALVNDLTQTRVVQATLDGHLSTGLTRPDYFNWPAELAADLSRYSPQVVVIMMGANDGQDLPGPPDVPYGRPAWDATYRSRVSAFVSLAASDGARVIWVGMPPMQDPGLTAKMAHLDQLVQQATRHLQGVGFLSTWTVLGTPTGQFTPYLVVGGQLVNVREPDGTHIAPGGAQVLSAAIETAMRTQLHVSL